MNKILTISIAAYNVERFLEQCLDSLLIPSMEKLEILIENDGSKDNTAVIGKQYEEKYPGVIRLVNKENGGYGSTINNSIRLATGKYFKQLDGDDWFNTDHLEQLVSQLESVDVDCVYTPYMEVYETDGHQCLRQIENIPAGEYPIEAVIGAEWFKQMHALAFRTQLLRDHNVTILENCFYTDQEYVVYPLLHTKRVYVYDKYIYCYRLGLAGQSVSLEGWKKHHAEHARVIKQLLSHYGELNLCHPTVKETIVQRISILLHDHYQLYMALGDKQAEMKALDGYIRKNHPAFFEIRKKTEGKRIKLLRLSGFMLYPLLRKKSK